MESSYAFITQASWWEFLPSWSRILCKPTGIVKWHPGIVWVDAELE